MTVKTKVIKGFPDYEISSDGRVFSCREEASEITGISQRTIWRDCNKLSLRPRQRLTFTYMEGSK